MDEVESFYLGALWRKGMNHRKLVKLPQNEYINANSKDLLKNIFTWDHMSSHSFGPCNNAGARYIYLPHLIQLVYPQKCFLLLWGTAFFQISFKPSSSPSPENLIQVYSLNKKSSTDDKFFSCFLRKFHLCSWVCRWI